MKIRFLWNSNLILPQIVFLTFRQVSANYQTDFLRSESVWGGKNETKLSGLLIRFKMNCKYYIWDYALI